MDGSHTLFSPVGYKPKNPLDGIYKGLESVLDVTRPNVVSSSLESSNEKLKLYFNLEENEGGLSALSNKCTSKIEYRNIPKSKIKYQDTLNQQAEDSPFQSSVGRTSNNIIRVEAVMNDLHKAIESKDVKRVREVVDQKRDGAVDVNEKFMGLTPLMLACICGCKMDVLKILLKEGANMDVKDNDNCTVLHHAVSECYVDLVRGILEYTKDNNEFALVHAFLLNSTDNQNNTALHYVSCKTRIGEEQAKAVKIIQLLKYHGCQLDKRNIAGETALHWAVRNANEDVAEELVSLGSNPYLQDNNSVTPDRAKKNPDPFHYQPSGLLQFLQRDVAQQEALSSGRLLVGLQQQQDIAQQQQQQQQNPSWQHKQNLALQQLSLLRQFLQQHQQQQQQPLLQSSSIFSSGNDVYQLLGSVPQLQNFRILDGSPLQYFSLPKDFRVEPKHSMLDNAVKAKVELYSSNGIEQILREQNCQLEQQIVELQTQNLLLHDQMFQMESQLKEYRTFAEQQLKIILRGCGVETDQAMPLFQ